MFKSVYLAEGDIWRVGKASQELQTWDRFEGLRQQPCPDVRGVSGGKDSSLRFLSQCVTDIVFLRVTHVCVLIWFLIEL